MQEKNLVEFLNTKADQFDQPALLKMIPFLFQIYFWHCICNTNSGFGFY
jgi:hypothetical protein